MIPIAELKYLGFGFTSLSSGISYWPLKMVLLEWYFGAIHIASNTLSNAMITSGNYRCNSFSTKHAIYSVASPALYKISKRPHGKEIVLVYHSYKGFCWEAEYKIYVRGNLSMIALERLPAKQVVHTLFNSSSR